MVTRSIPNRPPQNADASVHANVLADDGPDGASDAAYVALAERLGYALLTADQRLAAASTVTCAVEVLHP